MLQNNIQSAVRPDIIFRMFWMLLAAGNETDYLVSIPLRDAANIRNSGPATKSESSALSIWVHTFPMQGFLIHIFARLFERCVRLHFRSARLSLNR
jgi:hypothetical protein